MGIESDDAMLPMGAEDSIWGPGLIVEPTFLFDWGTDRLDPFIETPVENMEEFSALVKDLNAATESDRTPGQTEGNTLATTSATSPDGFITTTLKPVVPQVPEPNEGVKNPSTISINNNASSDRMPETSRNLERTENANKEVLYLRNEDQLDFSPLRQDVEDPKEGKSKRMSATSSKNMHEISEENNSRISGNRDPRLDKNKHQNRRLEPERDIEIIKIVAKKTNSFNPEEVKKQMDRSFPFKPIPKTTPQIRSEVQRKPDSTQNHRKSERYPGSKAQWLIPAERQPGRSHRRITEERPTRIYDSNLKGIRENFRNGRRGDKRVDRRDEGRDDRQNRPPPIRPIQKEPQRSVEFRSRGERSKGFDVIAPIIPIDKNLELTIPDKTGKMSTFNVDQLQQAILMKRSLDQISDKAGVSNVINIQAFLPNKPKRIRSKAARIKRGKARTAKTDKKIKENKRQQNRVAKDCQRAIDRSNRMGKRATLIAAQSKDDVNRFKGLSTEQRLGLRHNKAPERKEQRRLQKRAERRAQTYHYYETARQNMASGQPTIERIHLGEDKLKDQMAKINRQKLFKE
jgi:hypothetical protein